MSIINHSSTETLLSRKRKHSQVDNDSSNSIIIQDDNGTSQTFHIVLCIHRSQLPLTFLDCSGAPSRCFSAHIPMLEHVRECEQRVAIVSNGRLYAVERVKKGVYVLCRLESWATEDNLKALEERKQQDTSCSIQENKEHVAQSGLWWQQCSVSGPELPEKPKRQRRHVSMLRPDNLPPQDQDENQSQHQQQQVQEQEQEQQKQQQKQDQQQDQQEQQQQKQPVDTDDMFATFITQYLHTLYLSRTPLAFFAKGPVSRLRAAFTSGHTETLTLPGLVIFLRAMIQPSSSADKKYRDKLPEMLQTLTAADPKAKERKRRKRSKKQRLKPDKHAILADEDEYFEKWWERDDDFVAEETSVQSFKRRSASLRNRETLMQLILVLEVLSLEAMPECKMQNASKVDKNDDKKDKKHEHLAVLLELLADKLCIWNSLDTFDNISPDAPKDKNPDQLRNFCVEVIIPFYLSRIATHATSLNRKFGGPSSSATTKPNIHMHRKPPPSLRRSPSVSQPSPPLGHSASDSHHIKSQPSESPSLSSIPAFRRDSQTPAAPPSRRPTGIQQLRKREVDFTALAAANQAKQKKKAEIDEKLRDAISTLKRPNRVAANRDIADVAEQRRLMANARARTNLQRRSKATADKDKDKDKVHVAATPTHSRNIQSAIAATPNHISAPNFAPSTKHHSQPIIPSTGPICVPSSGVRPSMMPFSSTSNTQPRPQFTYEEVEEDTTIPATGQRQRTVRYEMTPTKPTLRRSMSSLQEEEEEEEEEEDQDEVGLPVFQTPSKPSRTVNFINAATPSRSFDWARRGKDKAIKSSDAVVAATPVKPQSIPTGDKNISNGTTGTVEIEAEGKSLYDVLGWNDDFSE